MMEPSVGSWIPAVLIIPVLAANVNKRKAAFFQDFINPLFSFPPKCATIKKNARAEKKAVLAVREEDIMYYKYELHCHTGNVSLCASVSPEDLVRRYEKAGYSGLVITNHFSPMTFWKTCMVPTKRQVQHYLSAYRRMRAFAGEGFTVLLGLELRHYATVNDYLIYGVEEDWLLRQPNLLRWNKETMAQRVHREGYLLYQAHPFRPFIYRCPPELLDGIEVFNGHTDRENNRKALAWARQCGKPMTSGSDTHTLEDPIRGGIVTQTPIKNNADLLQTLRSGAYELLGGETEDGTA